MQVAAPAAQQVQLNPAVVSAILWLILTMAAKAIGQRVTAAMSKGGDLALQVITLAFAWQISISLIQIPVLKFVSDAIRGGSQAALQATGWAVITGTVIGIVFLVLAGLQAKKFSELETKEMATAWQPLVLFTVLMAAGSATMPVINEVATWLGTYVAVPVGKGLAALINYVATLPHT
ncbi:MAG TPA: hypothetical protein VJ841_02420 [Candidatus Saccharimonadales bacterium]|nr:hypothetical protein [Candidatus Saccharimonadales bacterium]